MNGPTPELRELQQALGSRISRQFSQFRESVQLMGVSKSVSEFRMNLSDSIDALTSMLTTLKKIRDESEGGRTTLPDGSVV